MSNAQTEQEMRWFMENVRALRKRHGLSKEKMARLLHIGVGSLSKIESGQMPPRMTVEVVFNIQDHFRLSPESLFLPLAEQTDMQCNVDVGADIIRPQNE